MINSKQFTLIKYDFESTILFDNLMNNHYIQDLWSVIYIISSNKFKEVYIGETTDAYTRMSNHLKHKDKKKLDTVHFIISDLFNKSVALDIESNLIKYLQADGQFERLNANSGISNHNYYKKEEYWQLFKELWNQLRAEGLAKHSIEYINNSDLFKYSPYKSLTTEQKNGLLLIINGLLNNEIKNLIVEGGAGTGKTILAIFVFKFIYSDIEDFNFKEFGEQKVEFISKVKLLKKKYNKCSMVLVVPMTSFRTTLQKVFKNIKNLKANMVVSPTDVTKKEYDIILVDESHRLRRYVSLGAYVGAFGKACERLKLDKTKTNELEWVERQSKKLVLFYDERQSIKPSDVRKKDFDNLKKKNYTCIASLKSQFRVKGGNSYVSFIDKLLNCNFRLNLELYKSNNYEFILFDTIEEIVNEVKLRDKENGLSRLIAGYSWEWISENNKSLYDIEIDNIKLQWNSTRTDWINSENSINEVGCIHTTQGYDLNYAGIIFGNEISYDLEKNEIIIKDENYYDKNGKRSIENKEELKYFIINIYKTIMLRGIKGTYVYACDKNLREYFKRFIPMKEKKKEIELYGIDCIKPFINALPVYTSNNLSDFNKIKNVKDWILFDKEENIIELFIFKQENDSMEKVIPMNSLCLFRKFNSKDNIDGQIILIENNLKLEIKECKIKDDIVMLKDLALNSSDEELILLKSILNDKIYGVFKNIVY